MEDEEARRFFEGIAVGSSYAFPVVWDLAELTAEDLWMRVDDDEIAVEEAQLGAFLRAMAAAGVTLTADGKNKTYRLRESPPAGAGEKRGVGQAEPAPGKSSGKRSGKKKPASRAEEPAAPTYRLSGRYGDVVLSSEDPGEIYPDYEVAGVVDDLQFKSFPYNRDGDAQKLFAVCKKKMEGLMSSSRGRKKVLRTYAYYDMNDESWKADLLEDILAHYDLGKIRKE
jgi:hypothetical protein